MPDTDVYVVEDTSTKTVMRPPSRFNVVLYNDDRTTVEFVILVLMSIFHKSFEEAHDLTLHIHNNGRGVAGTYSHEVATQKCDETRQIALVNNHPLRCEIEEAQVSEDRKKWAGFTYEPKGPYLVLIIDTEWWDQNQESIDEWFDRNCPICKPKPNDTIITFQSQGQYTMWKMCWSPA